MKAHPQLSTIKLNEGSFKRIEGYGSKPAPRAKR
jgi:hypothetical protein